LKIKNKKSKKDNPGIPAKRYNKQNLKIKVYCYLHYFMRYILGYLAPKKGRPQTMIIVARKQD
jgi:hypothetical protein